jgi:hypothetical protein
LTLPANWPEKSELTDCVHEELSVDPEALGTWAHRIRPRCSTALVDAWYEGGRSSLLPVACTGELVSSRHGVA